MRFKEPNPKVDLTKPSNAIDKKRTQTFKFQKLPYSISSFRFYASDIHIA